MVSSILPVPFLFFVVVLYKKVNLFPITLPWKEAKFSMSVLILVLPVDVKWYHFGFQLHFF